MSNIQEIYEYCIALLIKEKIPISKKIAKQISINKRYKKTLATCSFNKNTYLIEINSYILTSNRKSLEEIILHELIHTIKGCFNHGKKFVKYCDIVNKKFNYNILVSFPNNIINYENMIIYKIQCQHCNKIYLSYNKTKQIKEISEYSCSCGGNLKNIN